MNTVTIPNAGFVSHRLSKMHRSRTATVPKTDEALLRRLYAGEENAFDELVNKHHGSLIRLAMGYVADRQVAEEVAQDTWMAVIQNLSQFEGRSSLRTWIFGILIHKAKDRGIREKRHVTFSAFEPSADDSEEPVDPSSFQQRGERAGRWVIPPQPWNDQTPEKLLASQQTINAMNNAIESLPRTLQEVLVLRDIEGMDVKEACVLLEITETNLYVRLHRARERVRKVVDAHLNGINRAV
jgi:RNA polymerase sigma-70 factor (ECF subfamily)